MFARSATFHGIPANIEAGIRFIKNEAGPLLDQIEGCRGLSFLVDRVAGQCIGTSSWTNEATMVAGDEQLRPVRDRARAILGGGSAEVDEWEIAVMHRSNHGESCLVSWIQGDLVAMSGETRVVVLPTLSRRRGFCSASLLVNRATGVACATTAWETRGAMEASRSKIDETWTQTANVAEGKIIDVHAFDLAYAHLHVPTMT